MFKKMYQKLENIEKKIKEYNDIAITFSDRIAEVSNRDFDRKKYLKLIDRQNIIIEQLSKALCKKYEQGTFVLFNKGELPIVIKDGKKITDESVTFLSIEWDVNEPLNIHIEQEIN